MAVAVEEVGRGDDVEAVVQIRELLAEAAREPRPAADLLGHPRAGHVLHDELVGARLVHARHGDAVAAQVRHHLCLAPQVTAGAGALDEQPVGPDEHVRVLAAREVLTLRDAAHTCRHVTIIMHMIQSTRAERL